MKKSKIHDLHQDVPPDHYHTGIKKNIFQKYWHSKRIKKIKSELPQDLGILLDAGCHGGFLTKELIKNKKLKNLYGIDISKEAVVFIKKKIPNGKFKVASIEKLPFKTQSFDTVFCFEVLEHIENPQKGIKEIKRVLKKNGTSLILVPTDNFLFRITWKIWLLFNPVWEHTHIQSYKGDSLIELLKKEKFKIEKVKRFNMNMLLLIKARK